MDSVSQVSADAGRIALSVVLLCHDELENLPHTLAGLEPQLVALGVSVEIVVVDDGSHDGTAEWLAARQGPLPLRVVRHAQRRGYGAAVRTGLGAASGERVAYLDGDGQYDPAHIPQMYQLMDEGWDLISGVRVRRRDPPHRLLVGWSYNLFIRRVTTAPLRDVDCGCKLLSRRVLDQVVLACDGNLVGAELLGKVYNRGLRILQIPVAHRPRQYGRPKGIDAFSAWSAVVELYTHWKDLRPGPR